MSKVGNASEVRPYHTKDKLLKSPVIEEIKQELSSKKISNENKFELLMEVLGDPNIDKHVKLDFGVTYLNNLKNSDSQKIMTKLHEAFQGDELYKPWVRYFDVTCKIEQEINMSEDIFRSGISELVQELLLENRNDQMDWRIVKKMLEIRDILFEEDTVDIFEQEDLFKPILVEITKALEFLLWKDPKGSLSSTKLTVDTLNKLEKQFRSQDKIVQEKLKEAVLSSRFDKTEISLPNTLVMGEDGGMYLLLNNLGDNQQIIKEVASDDYLKDKLQKKGETQQITIGKGGFGTVRFALSLFDSKSKPGELICIKKTENINGSLTPYEQIIDTTIRDYFTNNVADIIYAPNVFDMTL